MNTLTSHRPEDYAFNHWTKYESDAEHTDRVEQAEAEAGSLFTRATAPQKAAYNLAMADLRGLSGPRYDRARAAARAEWHRSTETARELFHRTADCLMEHGEVSPELDAEWDALIATPRIVQVGDHSPEIFNRSAA